MNPPASTACKIKGLPDGVFSFSPLGFGIGQSHRMSALTQTTLAANRCQRQCRLACSGQDADRSWIFSVNLKIGMLIVIASPERKA
jgi:hypothetical protein